MSDRTNSRKLEHIHIIDEDHDVDRRKHYFDGIVLRHRALPEVSLQDIDPSTQFLGKDLSFPLLISSMTGGDHELTRRINQNLAIAAEHTGVAMGVGSQRVMFTHPEARHSFEIRRFAPTAVLCGNLGAVQLNYGFTIDTCRKAVEVLEADALFLHLNPLQEAVQPEGDTDFANLAEKIIDIAAQLEVPVILKEVGAGISPQDAELLRGSAIRFIDVAGTGGTSWSRIENHRSHSGAEGLGMLFQDWGTPTPLALQRMRPYRDDFTFIASGGIRTGIDMAKSIILGASLCGLASPFLAPATESSEAVVETIERIRREFVTTMFLMGVKSLDELAGNEALILNP